MPQVHLASMNANELARYKDLLLELSASLLAEEPEMLPGTVKR